MSNKLKNIFSDKMPEFIEEIQFQDDECYKNFLEKLQIVQNEGRALEVEGISSFTTKVKDRDKEYPILKYNQITQFIIEPSTNDVEIILNTEYGKKIVLLKKYYTTNEIIFETDKDDIVYFKMVFIKNSFNFICRIQLRFAKTIKDIVEAYNTAIIFLEKIFKHDDSQNISQEYMQIYDMREKFLKLKLFFKKLYLVEQEFKLTFEPEQINSIETNEEELEELYWLIIEKKVIRLNAKLNVTESKGVRITSETQKLEVGSKINLTFLEEVEYTIYDKKISIHTANLLSNAIIKEIREEEDGTISALYGETDSEPMYISYSGFKTLNEAKQEMQTIMKHKKIYTDALTVNEYMKISNEF